MDLADLRREIDKIDGELAVLLEKRFAIAEDVALYKAENGRPVLDPGREQAVLQHASETVRNEKYRENVLEIFREMMRRSRFIQEGITEARAKQAERATAPADGRAAYCGIPGCNAEEAAIAFFGEGRALSPENTFEDVVKSVLTGQAAYGILPVENSSTGAVTAVEDLLYQNGVYITGELILPISHCLLGVPGASEAGIKTVVSHPQGIEQCAKYIASRGLSIRLSGNTAFAARDVAGEGDKAVAAIASERAAALYHLDILRRGIQTSADNYTRFVVVEPVLKEDGDKISIVCVIPHKPGSLYTLLSVFARHGLNLLKLLARPIAESAWRYRFHFDVSGSLMEKNVAEALTEARKLCDTFKVTGCYKAADKP